MTYTVSSGTLNPTQLLFCLSVVFQVYVVFVCLFLVVSTSAINFLERLISKMTDYVSSETVNTTVTHSRHVCQ